MSITVTSRRAADPRVALVSWPELSGVQVGHVSWDGLPVLDSARPAAAPMYAGTEAIVLAGPRATR